MSKLSRISKSLMTRVVLNILPDGLGWRCQSKGQDVHRFEVAVVFLREIRDRLIKIMQQLTKRRTILSSVAHIPSTAKLFVVLEEKSR